MGKEEGEMSASFLDSWAGKQERGVLEQEEGGFKHPLQPPA